MTRYAVYYAPPPASTLARFGAAWLGRDADTGREVLRPCVPGLIPARLAELTAFPFRYGLHATLKAPFELAPGVEEADLIAALEDFAARTAPALAPPLALKFLGGFLALMLSAPSPAVDGLEAACVEAFEPFRAPLSAYDRARRLEAPLTERQLAQLERWGYPYVFEDFVFHITLTGCLDNEAERAALTAALGGLLEGVIGEPLAIDSLCLFRQPTRETPFTILRRAALSGHQS